MRFTFEPRIVIIKPGDTVTWVNQEAIDHNIVTYPDGFPAGATGFESPYLSQEGERWSHTFNQAGSYEYHCIPHLLMGMHASVIVGQPPQSGEFHEPSAAEVARYRDMLLVQEVSVSITEVSPSCGETERQAGEALNSAKVVAEEARMLRERLTAILRNSVAGNRRKDERKVIDPAIRARVKVGGAWRDCQIIDISAGGARVVPATDLAVG